MKHLKKFNEGFFSNIFKGKKDETPITPEEVKSKSTSGSAFDRDELKIEAEEKFNSLVKELDSKLRNTTENYIEVKQNPAFKTKSTKSVNSFLLKMIEDHYTQRGFITNRSYDGRDNAKHDWFRIIAD